MVYRYTLPGDRIYYMTARKHRFYGDPPHEDLKDEIITQPLSLLLVCRLVNQELWPLVYVDCIFYMTIYSIRDLLYALDLLDKYATSGQTLRGKDIFYHMSKIQIRVNNFTMKICSLHHDREGPWILDLSHETRLWSGPGARSLLKTDAQVARTIRRFAHQDQPVDLSGASELKKFIQLEMLRLPVLDKCKLEKMLAWYHRLQYQRRRKSSASPV